MKDVIKGMFDWDRRANRINTIVTPVSSVIYLLLNYFHLIPKDYSAIQYVIWILFLFLYAFLFTTVVFWQIKRQSEKNLDKLHEDMEKLKESK